MATIEHLQPLVPANAITRLRRMKLCGPDAPGPSPEAAIMEADRECYWIGRVNCGFPTKMFDRTGVPQSSQRNASYARTFALAGL